MEYIIKLLSVNYEKHQKQFNKNIRLPSAIWRCAKIIEMTAAQTCMVVQIYRKNIVGVVCIDILPYFFNIPCANLNYLNISD